VTKTLEKLEGRTKQFIGEVVGDGRLAAEGDEQVRKAEVKIEATSQSDVRERVRQQ
jgi:uncharacterized protein YjbJ (UPF0337 family)